MQGTVSRQRVSHASMPAANVDIWQWIEGLQVNEERLRTQRCATQAGCVPTPPAIAHRMAQSLLDGRPPGHPVRLLDAGCGTAGLLTAAVREAVCRDVPVAATGVDDDAAAVAWAVGLSHLLQRAAGSLLRSWTIRRADYLQARSSCRYDLIISNPPYVSLRSLPEARRRALHRRFGSGRGDLAMLFLQTMLQQLAPEGRLCAIVPNKLLAAHYAEGLRRQLLSGFRVREVHDLSDARVFPGVGAYPVILVVDRQRPGGRIRYRDRDGAPRGEVEARLLQTLPGHLMPLDLPPSVVELFSRLRQQGSFGDRVSIQCGIAASGFGRGVGSGRERILLSGDVRAYRVLQRRAFDARRAGVVPARLQRQRVEKIVVPGMFQELCAARARSTDLLGRVYYIPVQEDDGLPRRTRAALLLALLNSRLLRVLYRGLFQAVSQAGGWLRLNGPYLAALPWPVGPVPDDLVTLVERAEAGCVDGVAEEIDQRVERLFGIRAGDVASIVRLQAEQRWKMQTGGSRASRRAAPAVRPKVRLGP